MMTRRALLLSAALLLPLAVQAQETRSTFQSDVATNLPSEVGAISAEDLRTELTDLSDSTFFLASDTLTDISDVNLGSLTDGQCLVYDNGTGKWVNQACVGAADLDMGGNDIVGAGRLAVGTATASDYITIDTSGGGVGGFSVIRNAAALFASVNSSGGYFRGLNGSGDEKLVMRSYADGSTANQVEIRSGNIYASEKMRVGGNINTSSIAARMDVVDSSNPQMRLTYTDGSVYTDLQTNSSGSLVLSPSSGYVGIGTSSPDSALTIASSATLATGIQLNNGGSTAYIFGDGTTLALRSNATTFNISGSSEGFTSSAGTGSVFITKNAATTYPIYSFSADGNTGIGRAAADTMTFYSGGEAARFNSSGQMGIGTTSPDRKLDVLDTSGPQARLTYTDGSVYTDFETDSSGYLNITPSGTLVQLNGGLNVGTVSSNAGDGDVNIADQLRVGINDAAYLYVTGDAINTSSGKLTLQNNSYNLGVGTSGPDRKLDVLDTSGPQARLTYTDGSVYTDLQTTSSGNLYIAPSGGNVGIGVASPSAKFEVLATTEQARLSYDASNYASMTVNSGGGLTFNSTGSSPEFTFSDQVVVNGDLLLSGSINIDSTPPFDHSVTGHISNDVSAGTTIAAFELVHLASDGEWALADADAAGTSTGMLGLALGAGTDGNPIFVAEPGAHVRDDTWNWTVGAVLYVDTTAGGITETAPSGSGDIVRVAGYAQNADTVYFFPSGSWEEIP